MCDAVLDQLPIRISVDHMMDSCLVSKWLRFNSTCEAHIHTCSWHRETEREREEKKKERERETERERGREREREREREQMHQTSKH